jgi:hypothetical protein
VNITHMVEKLPTWVTITTLTENVSIVMKPVKLVEMLVKTTVKLVEKDPEDTSSTITVY